MKSSRRIVSVCAIGLALLGSSAARAESVDGARTSGLSRIDERVDLKALTRRAQAGNAHAQYALALAYEEGRGGIKKDIAAALSWYEEAARNGLKIAIEKLRAISSEN